MAEADVEAAAALQVEAFGGVHADAVGRYLDGPRYSWRDAWVVDEGGEISAAAIAFPVTWWFRGVAYATSAVAAVAVRPVDRRRGLAGVLMRAILQADVDAGRPYSMLYPFQHGFYRRFGYASVGLMHYWRLPIAQLVDAPELRRCVRQLSEADKPAVENLFSDFIKHGAGGLERKPRQWPRRFTLTDEHWVVFQTATGIEGYLAYRTSPGNLEIRELVSANARAERGLWAFVAAQIEQRTSVTYQSTLDQPMFALLREPFMFEGPQHGFVINDVAGLSMSFMARIIDPVRALSSRVFPSDVSGSVVLDVADPILASGSYALTVANGTATVARTTAKPDVRCDIVTLSHLACGSVRAQQAYWHGLLESNNDAAVELLERAFPFGPPYIHPADWF